MRAKLTQSFKIQAVEKALKRMTGVTVKDIADDLGVGHSTLGKWITLAAKQQLEPRQDNDVARMTKEKRPQDWNAEEKLNMVIACASLDEEKISALCREQGLYPHHIKQWKQDFVSRPAARTKIIEWIEQARASGARQAQACKTMGMSAKTFQRWGKADNQHDGRLEAKHKPKNKLTELERQRIIKVANEPAYAHLPPNKIVPKLADEGRYMASESTFYRVLKAENQLQHRQKSKPKRPTNKPRALIASTPNQLYSWDITYLPSAIRGLFYYLYLVMDIYSRKIVGWQIYERESSALAADLMTDICQREEIKRDQVTLHSDNGSPMKGATMLATLQALGVVPSFSRPSVSNDNPYSESLFRTLKYRPEYPEKAFEDLLAARAWVQGFVHWYNHEHLHSAIKFVTPEQRHRGEDKEILAKRRQVYQQAKLKYPERWSGEIRNWDEVNEVYLNPDNGKNEAA